MAACQRRLTGLSASLQGKRAGVGAQGQGGGRQRRQADALARARMLSSAHTEHGKSRLRQSKGLRRARGRRRHLQTHRSVNESLLKTCCSTSSGRALILIADRGPAMAAAATGHRGCRSGAGLQGRAIPQNALEGTATERNTKGLPDSPGLPAASAAARPAWRRRHPVAFALPVYRTQSMCVQVPMMPTSG